MTSITGVQRRIYYAVYILVQCRAEQRFVPRWQTWQWPRVRDVVWKKLRTSKFPFNYKKKLIFLKVYYYSEPISVAARSKVWVYGRSLVGILGSNTAGCMDVCFESCVLSGRGLRDGLITLPGKSYRLRCVAMCNIETWWMRRPWSALGRDATGKKMFNSEELG